MRIGDWSSDVCTSALVMQVLRYPLPALVIAGALWPATAPAYTPEETTRLEALFQAAVDAGAGTELKDATVIAEGGIIVHGDAACEISKILNGDEVCAVTAKIGRASCRERVCQYV